VELAEDWLHRAHTPPSEEEDNPIFLFPLFIKPTTVSQQRGYSMKYSQRFKK